MKTVASERCSAHTLYQSVCQKLIYNNSIPHHGATKKNDTEQTFT